MEHVRAFLRGDDTSASAEWMRYGLVFIILLLIFLLVLAAFRITRPGVLPNTTLGDAPVGGLTEEELDERVIDVAIDRDRDVITIVVDDALQEAGVVAGVRATGDLTRHHDANGENSGDADGDATESDGAAGGASDGNAVEATEDEATSEDTDRQAADTPSDPDGPQQENAGAEEGTRAGVASAGREVAAANSADGVGADDGILSAATFPRLALGALMEPEPSARATWRRGRQFNPFMALSDHLRAWFGGVRVAPVVAVDPERFDAWVEDTASRLDVDPDMGAVLVRGTEVSLRPPAPGLRVDREALADAARQAIEGDGPQLVHVWGEDTAAQIDAAALEALRDDAERAVSGPLRLTHEESDEAEVILDAAQIAGMLQFSIERGEPRLEVNPEKVDALVPSDVRELMEVEGEDARFQLSDDNVEIIPSVDGLRFDADATAIEILEVTTAEASDGVTPREGELKGAPVPADLDTEEAEELGITERVSTFTTNFAPGESRVVNIALMAELINGVVLKPGDSFSINEFVGPRTREKGFTDGGVIVGREFGTEVGGGVSQYATTFFNAAFFGGYEIIDHTPHSFYISRYPEGREATLYYPQIDLVIRNDSPYGLLIASSTTASSVTVSMWGTDWVDVESEISPRRNITSPPTEYEENRDLPPGAERLVQNGRNGFTVTYTRKLQYHDGREEEQSWTHTYLPEPRIIERNTADPEPPDNNDDPPPTPDPPPPDPTPDPPDPPGNGEGEGEGESVSAWTRTVAFLSSRSFGLR